MASSPGPRESRQVYEAVTAVRDSLTKLRVILGQDMTRARAHARRHTIPAVKKALGSLFKCSH